MIKYIITPEGKNPFGYGSLEEAEHIAQNRQGNNIVWKLEPVSAINRETVVSRIDANAA